MDRLLLTVEVALGLAGGIVQVVAASSDSCEPTFTTLGNDGKVHRREVCSSEGPSG